MGHLEPACDVSDVAGLDNEGLLVLKEKSPGCILRYWDSFWGPWLGCPLVQNVDYLKIGCRSLWTA